MTSVQCPADGALTLCPSCGESNPAVALMCWACYTPLPGHEVDVTGRRSHERRLKWEQGLNYASPLLRLGGIALLVASGYFPQRRVLWASTGAALLGADWLHDNIPNVRVRFGRQERQNSEEEPPVVQIANTILLYALRDGATKIRLQAGVGIDVHYLIGEEWKSQMKIPSLVWNDLRDHLAERSQGWQQPVLFEEHGLSGEFDVSFEPSPDLPVQTVVLSLRPDATKYCGS